MRSRPTARAMHVPKCLAIFGLVLTLIGAGCGTYGVWVSSDEAIERGVSRFSGGTREQQLQLPAVQNLLEQSHFAVAGFVLIGIGTFLQIVAVLYQKRAARHLNHVASAETERIDRTECEDRFPPTYI
jgi:hypothetical protein